MLPDGGGRSCNCPGKALITSDVGVGSDTILPMLSGATSLSSVMPPAESNVTLAGKSHRGFQRRRTDRHRDRSRRRPRSHRGFGSPTYEVTSNRWDQQNRLVRAIAGTHESVYEYDGESRRVRIKELTSSVETKNETFVWCGSRICQKRSGSTFARNYFKQGFEEGTTDYFYTRDHLGSVREVVGSDGTTVASRVSYDPWGTATETGSVVPDFGFTGQYIDRSSGLALARYRGYSANLGRWMSRDPMGLRGGLNLYGYVNNRPISFIDPDGRYAVAAAPIAVEIGIAVYFAYYLFGPKSGPTLGPKPGPEGPKPGPGSPGPGPGGPGPGPGGGGGGPYRDPPPAPGPQYPECSGMSIAETNTCCRQATGYRGDFDGDECNPARQNYDDCMSENGW